MAPKMLSSALGWRCPQCTLRAFSTTSRQQAVGPEHPRYIDVPEPPQQTLPDRKPVKGILPVPRNVFAGSDKSKTDTEFIAAATQRPQRLKTPPKGSRDAWKVKMSEVRRRNLQEGVQSLRARQEQTARRSAAAYLAKKQDRDEKLRRPEREDERLTAPSNNLDLDALFNKPIPDPTRDARIQRKMENLSLHAHRKRQERLDGLHTLYMNARNFIVTPQQLDKAVEEAFGTDERPVLFGQPNYGNYDSSSRRSIWAEGRPPRVQDLLNRATRQLPRSAMDSASGADFTEINQERIRRIAEELTGGKMADQ